MIVKNEAHIIAATLENILKHIPIKYWVISDTGSTDDTKEIIRDFFQKRQIPGELVEHEWKDFAYNRTKALECAYQKTDYLFIFDADDSIEGTIQLPPLKDDRYMFRFGKEFSYERPLLVTNRKKWFFTGVLHEYLDTVFIHNVDKWGFVTSYFPILHIYYVNYKVLDNENMHSFVTLKELFNYTYKTSSEKLSLETIVSYLTKIGVVLEQAYKKLDKAYGYRNNVRSKKTTTKIKFTSTPKGITGKTIYNLNKQYTRKTTTRKQKIIQ
jgi:hypothetical protein